MIELHIFKKAPQNIMCFWTFKKWPSAAISWLGPSTCRAGPLIL